jgi:transposase
VLIEGGSYQNVLVAALRAAGLPVVIINPRRVREFAKSIGQLAPFNCDSGTLRGQPKIQGGRKRLRRALYSATVASVRCNPVLRPF